MSTKELINLRLHNQHISHKIYNTPEELVKHLIAVQSQVTNMAKWGLALRLTKSTNKQIEEAYNKGTILRTHVLRPTWHYVAPEDIRWLLKLTGPRVLAFSKTAFKQYDLNEKTFEKSNSIIINALKGSNFLHRNDLRIILEKEGFKADGVRLACFLMKAELEGIICSGPMIGKQTSYALLEERVSKTKPKSYEEALKELSTRYFSTRGPATIQDFSWWSGLTIKEIREGVEMLSSDFIKETSEGKEYIYIPVQLRKITHQQSTFLMPDFDEYGISYKDRSAFLSINQKENNPLYKFPSFDHYIINNGLIAGTWKPVINKKKLSIETSLIRSINKTEQQALQKSITKYINFFG